ncbi:CHAT domain-containing protein [Streptomyces sp. RKAG293]|uniref:CHAT domain-containing protein n=1 Tax=Streptomyces sp. RKAG293 TaxID=2893403 RepID=UPI0020349CB7|nr:CHAT domain-containing protein [Streptomyces sp. RKAG293]MCM2422608.1 CHAT domain-containing protein [Streptomyces sp. RKAG293]
MVHFTGHAGALPDDPLESALSLGEEQLTVRDVLAGGSLRARMAVLSACQTSVIGDALPDEAVGLPSALLQAGLSGVVATQWAAYDSFTLPLISAFYDEWLRRGAHPAVALARAQRACLRGAGDPSPFAWANFSYTGF